MKGLFESSPSMPRQCYVLGDVRPDCPIHQYSRTMYVHWVPGSSRNLVHDFYLPRQIEHSVVLYSLFSTPSISATLKSVTHDTCSKKMF